MKYVILLLSISSAVCAEPATVYDGAGPIIRQSVEGNRIVQRRMDGTMLGYWTREGGNMVYRAPDGTLLERVR